jgi:hypothetical protein
MNVNHKGRTAVFGIYNNQTSVENAVDNFKMENFRNSDISVLMPTKETNAPEGAITGALSGTILGGGLGWLAGLGALAIPGVGPFVAAGPIMASLAGAGMVGTLGGITGALIGVGIPEYEAKRYEGLVKAGGILLSVHVDDSEWENKAKKILEMTGAENIASAGEKSSEMKTDYSFEAKKDSDNEFPESY